MLYVLCIVYVIYRSGKIGNIVAAPSGKIEYVLFQIVFLVRSVPLIHLILFVLLILLVRRVSFERGDESFSKMKTENTY